MRERAPLDRRRQKGYIKPPKQEDRWVPKEPEKKRKHPSLAGEILRGGVNTLSAGAVVLNLGMADVKKQLTDALMQETSKIELPLQAYGMPKSFEETITNPVNQDALDNAIVAIQENLRDPRVLKALRGEGEDPILDVVNAIEIPVSPELLEGTMYNPSAIQEQYPLLIKTQKGIGNGVRWNNDETILTAAHVIRGVGSDTSAYPAGIDVEIGYLNSQFSGLDSGQVVKKDPDLTNNDIQGQFVRIIGKDDGIIKTLAGVAVKISPGLARYWGKDSERLVKNLENSFMFILPPDQIKSDKSGYAFGIGMSGSAVYLKDGTFAGVFWGVSPFIDNVNHRTIGIGLFSGIDEVRRAIADAEDTKSSSHELQIIQTSPKGDRLDIEHPKSGAV